MANLVIPPYEVFTDANGDALEDGYIFIGEPGLSPITNPLQAYWDADLSIPANDIRTKGGYAANSGTPARLYTATNYSIVVQDKNQRTIYTQLDSVDYINSASGSLIALVDTIADLRGLALANPNDQASVGGSVTVGDGLMGPLYYWNATSSAVDNGVSIIKPTSTSGNGRWLWINTNAPMEVVNIDSSVTLDLAFLNRIFLVDTALDLVLAVPDGDFQGQDIQIANKGVSTLEITGTGIPVNTFIDESGLLTWIGTEWGIIYRATAGASISESVKGYSAVSLSEYATDLSPVVKGGSVFEANGAIITIGSDLAPTGYAGVTVSTTFYLYYDAIGGGFIYDETTPVWSDTLQGWYDGNNRALFSMFKDSGGILYQLKMALLHLNNGEVTYVKVNSDLVVRNEARVEGDLIPSKGVTISGSIHSVILFDGQVYLELIPSLDVIGKEILVSGVIDIGGTARTISKAERKDSTTVALYWGGVGGVGTLDITEVGATVRAWSIAW